MKLLLKGLAEIRSVQGGLLFNELSEKLRSERSLISFKNLLKDYSLNTILLAPLSYLKIFVNLFSLLGR